MSGNPFGTPRVGKKFKRGAEIEAVLIDTGEYVHLRAPGAEVLHDGGSFAKLFRGQHLLIRLKNMGEVKLLGYISEQCHKDKDVIGLGAAEVMAYTGMKHRADVSRAKKGLVELGVIAKKQGNEYWINIEKIFNGDRRNVHTK
jgi:hypothetical protein